MSRRRRRPTLPKDPVILSVDSLSHDGRGIARLEGKICFVDGALPGETVDAVYTGRHRRFDELRTVSLGVTSEARVEAPCAHADICGGCSLQHMAPSAQIAFKQETLKEHFAHFGGIAPAHWEAPMTAAELGYRRKARLGVRYVTKREEVLVGFREKRNSFITAIDSCAVLDPRVGQIIPALQALILSLSVYRELAQIEVACGDEEVALVFRHLAPLAQADVATLVAFGQTHGVQIYLQPKGPDTVHKLWPESGEDRLSYTLEAFGVRLYFHPMDFTQVNAPINQQMVDRALAWLDPQPEDRVLDLFCGLGNFTIPLATRAGHVVGVEGDERMVIRGGENAERNGLTNVEFHAADLQADFTAAKWAHEGFDKILIDPPRSGAIEVVQYLPAFGAKRIVYVSCNPATLARDAGALVAQGYKLIRAGVMDMFPHTAHVESMALFERVDA
ncbi:MAG: 23S rRNA (uracil(1939)-C(5))-methyltransferase RlmD [Alteromonadaceae bacterium]|nr:23S rRNA (uracil(1939)-C(5))-methyltransferase RlmD [Alteromonadaceae bacterium]